MNATQPLQRTIRWLLPIVLALLCGCASPAPILVGFTAELTGKQSEPGLGLQYGAQMAVDQLNAAGGIHGRKIALVVQDDHGNPEGARAAENVLIASNVVAILGHYTSAQTVAGFDVPDRKGTLLLSATASTSLLSGKKDLFYRTVISTDGLGHTFAEYIHRQRALSQVAILYDQENAAYALPLAEAFSASFIQLGGVVTSQISFEGSKSPNFGPLVTTLRASNPQGVLIIASPAHTAIIAQVIRLEDWHVDLFSSSWGQGPALIQNGGKAIDGMEIIIGIDVNDPAPALKAFKADYEKLYGRQPSFTAMEGYETMLFLGEGLKITGGSASGLPDALASISNFQGLTGPIRVDKNGDAVRPLYIQRVHDQNYETIQKLEPAGN